MSLPALPVLAPRMKDEVGSLADLKRRYARVKKNSKGTGLHFSASITQDVFDVLADGRLKLNAAGLEKIRIFFPDVSDDELRSVLGPDKGLTVDDVNFLLIDNTVAHYDPVKEAFKAFCDTYGSFDAAKLQSIMGALGTEMSDEDVTVLLECAGTNGTSLDLEQFRALVEYAESREPTAKEKLRQQPKADDY